VCNRQLVARGTRVYELLGAGELPLALDDVVAPMDVERLGGDAQLLEAKVPEFELVPGDVVVYTWQGGGGYGDPLDRNAETVERDVSLGVISDERARSVYGVPGDRDALRRERLRDAELPAEPGALPGGEKVGTIGLALVLARGSDGLVVQCACGQPLGAADGDWRRGCAVLRPGTSELPRGIVVHPTLELVRYLCPACGRQHGVEVAEREGGPLLDFRLGSSSCAWKGRSRS
jgi:N-methylhydantoinase B